VSDFIEEVEERLRSERYRSLALAVGPWLIALVVALIIAWLAVWGYNGWQSRKISSASVVYDKALTELSQGDQTGAYTDLDPVAKSGPAGYRTLALLQQGNIRLADNKADEAAALFDQAAKAAPDSIMADLARLRAALALMDTAPYPQLKTRLTALIGDKKPFDLQAREALAMAKLEAGKTTEARGDFNALVLTLGAPKPMQATARAAIALIDAGEVPAALAAAKAAATLPPPSPGSLQELESPSPSSGPASNQSAPAPNEQGQPGSAQ
jgi:hypothetical protein